MCRQFNFSVDYPSQRLFEIIFKPNFVLFFQEGGNQSYGRRKQCPLALVLAPTRELATQVQLFFESFCFVVQIRTNQESRLE